MSAPGGGESIQIDAEIGPLLAKLQQLEQVATSLRSTGVGDRPSETLSGLQNELEQLFNPEIVRRFGETAQQVIQEAVANGFRGGFERGTESLAQLRATLTQATSQTPGSVLGQVEAARGRLDAESRGALPDLRETLRGVSPEVLAGLTRPLQADISKAIEGGFEGGVPTARRVFNEMRNQLRDALGLGVKEGLSTPGKTAQERKAARDEPAGALRSLDTGTATQAESALTGPRSIVAQAGGTATERIVESEDEELSQQEIIKNLVTRRREGLQILLDYEDEILVQDREILNARTEEAEGARTSVEIVGQALAMEAERVQAERAISQRLLAQQGIEPGSYSANRASTTISNAEINAQEQLLLSQNKAYARSLGESTVSQDEIRRESETVVNRYRQQNTAQIGQEQATRSLTDAQIAAARATAQANNPEYAEAQASIAASSAEERVQQQRLLAVLPGYVDNLAELAVLQAQQRREIEESINADREANAVAIGLANADRSLTEVRIKAIEAEANRRQGPQRVRDQASTAIDDAALKADLDQTLAASRSYISSVSASAVAHEQERVAVQERVAAYRAANADQIGYVQASSAEADAKIAAVKAETLSASQSYLDDVVSQKIYSAETALATREALVQMQEFATQTGQTNAAQREVKVAMAERLIKLRQDLAVANEQVALSQSAATDDQETLRMKGQLLVANRRLQEATNVEAQAVIDAAEKSGQLGRGTVFQRLEASLARRQGTAPVITEEQSTLGQFVGQGALRALRFGVGATAGFAAIQGLRDSIQEAENLDQALSQTRVTLSAIGQSQDFEKFRGQILSAARDTGTASDQVAVLATQLAATFQNTDVAASNVRTSLQVAKITGADLETTTQQLRAASEGFGLQGSDAFRQISDAAISTANVFGVKAQDIIGFLSGVGAEAREAGLSVQQVAAIGGAIADVSAKSGQALGDTFARILPQVSAQAAKVAEALRGSVAGQGIADTFVQQIGSGQSGAALETLIANFGKLDLAQQNNILHTIGGRRETEALTAVIENYQREQLAAASATGSTQTRFDALQGTLKQQISELLEGLKQIAIAVADSGVLSLLKDVVSLLRLASDAVGFLTRGFETVNHALGGMPARLLEIALLIKAINVASGSGVGGIGLGAVGSALNTDIGALAQRTFTAVPTVAAGQSLASGVTFANGSGFGAVSAVGSADIAAFVPPALAAGLALIAAYGTYEVFLAGARDKLNDQVKAWMKDEEVKPYSEQVQDLDHLAHKHEFGNPIEAATSPLETITGGAIGARARLYRFGGPFHQIASNFSPDIERQIKENNAEKDALKKSLDKEISDDQDQIGRAFQAAGDIRPADLNQQIKDLQKADPNLAVVTILDKIAKNNKLPPDQEAALLAALGRITGPDPVQTAQDDVDQASAQLDSLKQQQSEGKPVIPQVLAGYDKLLVAQQAVVSAARQQLQDATNRHVTADIESSRKALLAAQNSYDHEVADRAKEIEAAADALVELDISASQAGGDPTAILARLQALLSTPNISNAERIKLANDIVGAFRQQQQRELAMANGINEVNQILNESLPDATANNLLLSGLATDAAFQNTEASLTKAGVDLPVQQVIDLAKKADESTSKAAIDILEKKRDDLHVLIAFDPTLRPSLQGELDALNSAIGSLSADPGVALPKDDPQTKVDAAVKALHDQTAKWKQLAQLSHYMDPVDIAAAEMGQALEEIKTTGVDVNGPVDVTKLNASQLQAYQDYLQAQADQRASAQAITDAQDSVVNARLAGDDVGLAEQAKNKAAQDAAKAVGKAEELQAEAERISADNQYQNAMKALFDAQENILIAYANMAGDTVTAARDAQVEAQDAVNRRIQDDIRNGVNQANDTTLLGLKARLINAQSQSEQAYVQDRRDTIDFQLQMHQISTSQAISQLQALEDQVRMTTNNQKDLREIELQIQQLRNQADQNLQFNLPSDINLPTLYEVRRLNQTPAGQGYVDNRQVSIVFQINNGMDAQTAMRMVSNAVGSTATTYGTALKRY